MYKNSQANRLVLYSVRAKRVRVVINTNANNHSYYRLDRPMTWFLST